MKKIDKKNLNLDDFRFENRDYEIESNPELRDYLRVMYDQIKYENKMVGEFSIYGTYKIRPEMRDYLIKEVKHVTNRSGDVVYAEATTEKYTLHFIITFNIVGQSQQAFLDFEERELRIDEDNIIHKTRLAEIVKTGHPDFVNYVFKRWNVWASSSIELKESPLMTDLFGKIVMFEALRPVLATNSIFFVNSLLALLPNCGPLGILIAREYNQRFAAACAINPKLATDGMFMKKLLDSLMRKHNFFPILAGVKEATPVVKGFVEPIKTFDFSGKTIKKNASLDKGREL